MKNENEKPEKEKKDKKEKEGGIMNFAVFSKLIEVVSQVTGKTIDFMDSKKYADAVNELTNDYDAVFAEIKDSIVRDESLTEAEKRQALLSLNDEISKRKENAGKDIREHQNHAGQLVLKIFAGLMTVGISFAPEVIARIKQQLPEKEGQALDQMVKEKEIEVISVEDK